MENKTLEYHNLLDNVRQKLYMLYEAYTSTTYRKNKAVREDDESTVKLLDNILNNYRSQINVLEEVFSETDINFKDLQIKAAVRGYKDYLQMYKGFNEEDLQ